MSRVLLLQKIPKLHTMSNTTAPLGCQNKCQSALSVKEFEDNQIEHIEDPILFELAGSWILINLVQIV